MAICEWGLPCPLKETFTGCGGIPLNSRIKKWFLLIEYRVYVSPADQPQNQPLLPGFEKTRIQKIGSGYGCLPGAKYNAHIGKQRFPDWEFIIYVVEGKKVTRTLRNIRVDCVVGGI